MAIARDRTVDQSRVDFGQGRKAEAQAIHHTRTEVLQYDVGLFHEPADRREVLCILEIQRDALLSRIQLAEVRTLAFSQGRPQAHVIPSGWLDLDHVCAQIGEQAAAVGAGHHDREIQNPQAGQCIGWNGHAALALSEW
ncbi:hypothetical protein FQZ97_1113170 [compost metagenome]